MSKLSRYQEFLQLLTELFGVFDAETKKFERQSNSVIARELFYSDSQFSRLINETASDGEYVRAIKVVKRYREFLGLKQQSLGQVRATESKSRKSVLFWGLSVVVALLLGGSLTYWWLGYPKSTSVAKDVVPMDHLLQWAFEDAHVKSFVSLDELPADCNYPCYRLQGKWELSNDYKLPVFGEQSGFHYWAIDVNMYARCRSESDSSGKTLEGFEYQRHEIWYDQRELPVDSFLIRQNESLLQEEYQALDFRDDPDFVRVAQVHTFFRDEFDLSANEVNRSGKVIGRYIEYEPLDSLIQANGLKDIDLETEVKRIVQDRVKDFSRPIRCETTQFSKPSFSLVEEQDELVFECALTTGHFPIQYTKAYRLVDQHIKNACRPQTERQ